MAIEFDEKKRQKIKAERDLDILDAALIFERPEAIIEWVDRRRDYGEERIIAVGIADGIAYRVTYTWRGEVKRLITAWKITNEDYEKYKARNSG